MESSTTTRPGHGISPASVVVVMGLIIIWALIDVGRSYPSSFHPRFWDEAVYLMDVRAPGALLAPDEGKLRYAPAKLGYGLPLAGSVKLFGDRGAMYLSTACWLLVIAAVGTTVFRRLGAQPGLFAAAFLAYSPLFGKYVAEAGPTSMAALCLVVLWITYPKRRFWVVGLVMGFLAFVDFKWMPPVAASIVVAELFIERRRSWGERLMFVGCAALVALAILTAVKLVHSPFGDYLWSYISRHSEIVGFEPSGIFGYYLLLFGAMPAVTLAFAGCVIGPIRRGMGDLGPDATRSLLYALVFSGGPILFYSLFGSLKALRFYAVMFPLFTVPVAVGISLAASWLLNLLQSPVTLRRRIVEWGVAVLMAGVILLGSDGPARHLRVRSCFPAALERLFQVAGHEGAISSYIWPVVHYGWRYPLEVAPFTLWGLGGTDKWLAVDPILDRVTIEMRLALDPSIGITPDSLWSLQTASMREFTDSLFSVPSDFYASDYFMCEQVVVGIPTLRRWRSYRRPEGNSVTMRRIDQERLWKFGGKS